MLKFLTLDQNNIVSSLDVDESDAKPIGYENTGNKIYKKYLNDPRLIREKPKNHAKTTSPDIIVPEMVLKASRTEKLDVILKCFQSKFRTSTIDTVTLMSAFIVCNTHLALFQQGGSFARIEFDLINGSISAWKNVAFTKNPSIKYLEAFTVE